MEVNRRKSAGRSVVAGSVWESRMKMDEVKGGIKVFNGEENLEESNKSFEQNQRGVVREKRKTWKCEPVIDPILIRKVKFDESYSEDFHDSIDGFEKNPVQNKNTRSVEPFNRSIEVIEKNPIQRRKSNRSRSHKTSDESCKEFDGDEKDKVVVKEEIEVSKKSVDVKEVKLLEERSKKVLILKEKINQNPKATIPISANLKKQQTHVVNHSVIHPTPTKPSPVKVPEKNERFREPHNKFQNLVDIVMWRDILKSSLMFGIGTLILLLSSVTEDLNFSLISAISYLGLLCIAAIFFYKAILCRGPIDLDDSNLMHTVEEEEAMCLVKVVLPWLNKCIVELRHLLSGDPATTMKFAGSLFLLARCGSFITIWRMAILGFFGVFTVPKVYSWYSRQLMEEGSLWLSRCRNAWNSYTYLKVVAVAIFTLLWSSSANVARVWEVFMLIVAVRYYQDLLMMKEEREVAAYQKEADIREKMMKEETRAETESEWRAFFS